MRKFNNDFLIRGYGVKFDLLPDHIIAYIPKDLDPEYRKLIDVRISRVASENELETERNVFWNANDFSIDQVIIKRKGSKPFVKLQSEPGEDIDVE